jgi:four helix bundle protein
MVVSFELSAMSCELSANKNYFIYFYVLISFMRDFLKLEIWQRSHSLTLKIYEVTKTFPKEEVYGLSSQMRRSCSSIPTNIAEGCGRNSHAQTIHFFQISLGSCSELMYQLILCKDLTYIADSIFKELYNLTTEIRKMIYAYSQKLKADS